MCWGYFGHSRAKFIQVYGQSFFKKQFKIGNFDSTTFFLDSVYVLHQEFTSIFCKITFFELTLNSICLLPAGVHWRIYPSIACEMTQHYITNVRVHSAHLRIDTVQPNSTVYFAKLKMHRQAPTTRSFSLRNCCKTIYADIKDAHGVHIRTKM